MQHKASQKHALVIGAGIVGIQCALELQRRGFRVTVADRRAPGTATSEGNAGCIATAEIFPISMPGLLWSVPGMLLDPFGPLSIHWRHAPRLAPWLWRFLLAGRAKTADGITRDLAGLLRSCRQDHAEVARRTGTANLYKSEGFILAYETEKAFTQSAHETAIRAREGIVAIELDRKALSDMEPALSPHIQHGIYFPQVQHTVNPRRLVEDLAAALWQGGSASQIKDDVVGFGFADNAIRSVKTSNGAEIDIDLVIVAAGAWSKDLCRQLGYRVPLDTERGYNTTLSDPQVTLTRPVCVVERNVVLTPMEAGLRIGGAVELAGLDAPPNFERAKVLLKHGATAVPGLNTRDGKEWMGFRPSMPDSKPVISRSRHHANVMFAFGHGHLGLTLSATTARIIGDFATTPRALSEHVAYSIERFS